MKFPTIKQCCGGALMLTALVASPAMLKTSNANAFSPNAAAELNLTSEQQAELNAIKDNAHTQIEAILTEDQLAELDGQTGRDRRQAMRSINLSEEQRTQLQAMRAESRASADEVLTDEQQAQLQAMRADRIEGRKNRREEFAEELNLTAEQRAELDAIKEDARTRVEAILTEEQLAALEGKTGRERGQAMRSLNLSEDQRAELQVIREESRVAADAVLTDEQKAQQQEILTNRGNRRPR